jgi:hypothetical protein
MEPGESCPIMEAAHGRLPGAGQEGSPPCCCIDDREQMGGDIERASLALTRGLMRKLQETLSLLTVAQVAASLLPRASYLLPCPSSSDL